MRTSTQHPRFIDPVRQRELAKEWSRFSRIYEAVYVPGQSKKRGFTYIHNRTEDQMMPPDSFPRLPMSPLNTVIPALIASKRKVRILDLGAGSCQYTDQIRETFGDKVKVFSTGLSRRVAEAARKDCQLAKLHRDDLVCQSIEQMRNYPEFDLIISVFGEVYYGAYGESMVDTFQGCDEFKLRSKLDCIIRKLNPGGLAMISPLLPKLGNQGFVEKLDLEDLELALGRLLLQYKGHIEIDYHQEFECLIIHKLPRTISEEFCSSIGSNKLSCSNLA